MRGFRALLRRQSIRAMLRGMRQYFFGRRGQRRVAGLRLYYRMRMMVILRSAQPLGKLARVSDIRLWVDGAEAFDRVEKLLRRARHTILVQMFIWVDDDLGRRIASALVDAADRGVQVEVRKEAVGDFFEIGGDFLGTKESGREVWQRFWHHPRIRVTHDAHRDHAKVFIIDDQIMLLTGMNMSDEYIDLYHDYLVELRGAEFVTQYLSSGVHRTNVDGAIRLFMNTEERKEIRPALMRLLASARESIFLEHSYVSDPDVIDTLLVCLRRGIRVTVIIPRATDLHNFANMASVGRLLTEGFRLPLRVFLYGTGRIHGKVILVDNDTAFIGSANLIRSSLDDMGEVNVLVSGKHRFLWKLRDTLKRDLLKCTPLHRPPAFLWMTRLLSWLGL